MDAIAEFLLTKPQSWAILSFSIMFSVRFLQRAHMFKCREPGPVRVALYEVLTLGSNLSLQAVSILFGGAVSASQVGNGGTGTLFMFTIVYLICYLLISTIEYIGNDPKHVQWFSMREGWMGLWGPLLAGGFLVWSAGRLVLGG